MLIILPMRVHSGYLLCAKYSTGNFICLLFSFFLYSFVVPFIKHSLVSYYTLDMILDAKDIVEN